MMMMRGIVLLYEYEQEARGRECKIGEGMAERWAEMGVVVGLLDEWMTCHDSFEEKDKGMSLPKANLTLEDD